jgi:hypothetical protein
VIGRETTFDRHGRPSTSSGVTKKGVDARIKSGHDDSGLLYGRLLTTDFVQPESRGTSPARTFLESAAASGFEETARGHDK